MKKITMLMILMMTVSCICVFAGGRAGGQNKINVTLWGIWDQNSDRYIYVNGLAQKFMQANPDINVEVLYSGFYSETAEKIEAAVVARNNPVLSYIEETYIGRFDPVAEDLSKYLSKSVIDNYSPGLLKTCYVNNVMKAVPFGRSTAILYLNKTLLREAGLPETGPKTWDELEQFTIKAANQAKDVYGFSMFHDTDAWFWESALYSWGGSVYGSDYKTLQFNTPDARKIIDVTQRLSKSGHMFNPYQFQGNWGDLAFEKFASGKAAMFFGSISGLPAMNNILKGLGMDFGVCFMPMGSKYSVVTGGGNIMMFKNATDAQKKAAAKFLEFLATDENAIGWTNITGYLPTTKTAANSSYFKNFLAQTPFYQIAVDQTETASTRPLTETWIAVQAIITEELNATLQDTNYSSQRAMQSAYDRGMVSIRNLE